MGQLEKTIKQHPDGAILNLFVTPGTHSIIFPAGFNKWRRCIEIKVKSPAKDNKANKDVIKTVADFFNMPIGEVFVVAGGKKKEKTVLLKGANTDFVCNKLRESLNGL